MPPPPQGTLTTISLPTGPGAAIQVDNQGAAGYVQIVEGIVYDGNLVALGATTDPAAATDGGTASLMALVKRLLGKLPTLTLGTGGGLKVEGGGTVAVPAGGVLSVAGATDVTSGSVVPTTSYQTVIPQRICGATRHRGLLVTNTSDQATKVQINCHVNPGSATAAVPFNITIPAGSTTAQVVYITSQGYVSSTGTTLTLNFGAYAAIDGPFSDLAIYAIVAGTVNATVGSLTCELLQIT